MPPSTTRSRRRGGQPVPLSTGLSTGSCPRQSTAVSGPSEAPDSGGTKDVGPGPDRLDRRGTRPGGPTLSSLPLDEWHYMRINEMVCVRLRPARRHACQRAAKRPGRSFRSSTVDPVGSLSPDLSPRTWLPQPLQTAEPALGAGPASAGQPVGTTHRICKAKLPSCSLGRSSAPSPATRDGYASPARLTHWWRCLPLHHRSIGRCGPRPRRPRPAHRARRLGRRRPLTSGWPTWAMKARPTCSASRSRNPPTAS
jgi:hypothetical protein